MSRRRAAAVATLWLAAACGGPAPDPDAVPAEGPYVDVANAVTTLVEHELATKRIPALSIALVDGDRTVWARGFGSAGTPTATLASANTVYRIGSVSKLFTDIGIMQLVERGEIDLDAPVRTYIPDFAPANPFGGEITLRHLMSHRAGLTREPPVGNYFDPSDSSLARTVASLNGTTLFYPPGERTKYSNAGIAAAGFVLERVSGQPFARYLKAAVLEPMGLRSSAFEPEPELVSRLARGTMWTYDEREFDAPTFGLGMAPAGSMYATVHDLARFARVLFTGGTGRGYGAGGRVLRRETLESMWEPQFAPAGARSGFGLGFYVHRDDSTFSVSHNGAIYGFATQFTALPDEGLAVAAVGTRDFANVVVTRIAETALGMMRDVKAGRPIRGIDTTAAVPDSLMRRFEGDWAALDRRIEIDRQGEKLVAWRAGGEFRMTLRHWRGDTLLVDDELQRGPRVWRAGERLVFGADTLSAVARPPLPPEPPAAWRGLIGEYGWDHNTLFILERDGRLSALIEWFATYPLRQVDDSTWRFPDSGLYAGEDLVFRRDARGRATEVRAANVRWARRSVGPEDGSVFRIEPTRPVEELRREALAATPPVETGEFRDADLVELVALDPTIKLDIRYADTTNFMGTRFYDEARAFLQRPAAEAVAAAHRELAEHGFGLLIHDGYRPWYVTRMFWDGTDPKDHTFVADPSRGSRHNRGCAVDLTLYDLRTGRPVTTTGSYDEFSNRSYPYYPGGTSRQRWLRDLLRRTMEAHGFAVYEAEWWHFDHQDWRSYRIGNAVFSEIGRK